MLFSLFIPSIKSFFIPRYCLSLLGIRRTRFGEEINESGKTNMSRRKEEQMVLKA
ncbi:hypothetical protein LguiB_034194 [Lonicera macranthoides]